MSVTTDTAPHAAPARGMNALGDLSQHIVRVLENNGADISKLGVPPQPEPTDGLWEDVSVPQARARLNAWRNSVIDACYDEYLRFRFSDLDPNQKPKTLENWLGSLVEAKKQGARPDTINMIMPGPIGSGKTTGALALGNEAAERGLWTLLVKHSKYLTWLQPDSAPHNLTKNQVRHRFATCDFLILDELCGEMDQIATPAAKKETVDLIDARISSGRPTAYTTNVRSRSQPGGGLGVVDILGERLLSRLESSAYLVKVIGPDRRKPAEPLDW
jgi:DNA replication protein DnaC